MRRSAWTAGTQRPRSGWGEIALARSDLRAAKGRFEQALALQHEFPQARHLLDEMRLALDGAGVVGVVRNYHRSRDPFSQRLYYIGLTFEVVQHDGAVGASGWRASTNRARSETAMSWRCRTTGSPGNSYSGSATSLGADYVEISGGFTSQWPQYIVGVGIALIGLMVIGSWVIFALGIEPPEVIDWVNEQLN